MGALPSGFVLHEFSVPDDLEHQLDVQMLSLWLKIFSWSEEIRSAAPRIKIYDS